MSATPDMRPSASAATINASRESAGAIGQDPARAADFALDANLMPLPRWKF